MRQTYNGFDIILVIKLCNVLVSAQNIAFKRDGFSSFYIMEF